MAMPLNMILIPCAITCIFLCDFTKLTILYMHIYNTNKFVITFIYVKTDMYVCLSVYDFVNILFFGSHFEINFGDHLEFWTFFRRPFWICVSYFGFRQICYGPKMAYCALLIFPIHPPMVQISLLFNVRRTLLRYQSFCFFGHFGFMQIRFMQIELMQIFHDLIVQEH